MELDSNNPEPSIEEIPQEPILNFISSESFEHDGTLATFVEFDVMSDINTTEPASLLKAALTEISSNGFNSDNKQGQLAENNYSAGSGADSGGSNDGDDPFKNITLANVGGLEDQIAWLKQCILKPLQDENNNNYSWGVKPPKGVLFYGPPGCGKTLLARAFGNELSKELGQPVKLFHRKGGDCFSMWFGESSENLRKLFRDAINAKPSIIFFDELDGLCPSRDGTGMSEANNSVVTTLLGLMDTLPVGEVFVFGATNRVESVDPAMLRPGRFDKHLEFFPPGLEARKQIITINTSKWYRSKPSGKDLTKFGEKTVGYTGADIEKLCREAFFAAFDRHVPNADINGSIKYMEILESDWNVAFSNTKPTNTAVFGSTLYIPQLPNPAVNSLFTNIQNQAIEKLLSILPKRSQAAMDLAENGDGSAKITTFLLSSKNTFSAHAIETNLLPGILVHPKIVDYPVYILSLENILSRRTHKQLDHITETVNQVLNSVKPCILYMPRLEDLANNYLAPFIARQLLQLRGKPVLILATSSELPAEHHFRTIFGASNSAFAIRLPNQQERLDFFRPMFTTLGHRTEGTVPNITDAMKKKLDNLHKTAAEMTKESKVDLVLSLHDALMNVFVKYFNIKDKRTLPGELGQILNEYNSKKFMF